jgi:hypothetical protein
MPSTDKGRVHRWRVLPAGTTGSEHRLTSALLRARNAIMAAAILACSGAVDWDPSFFSPRPTKTAIATQPEPQSFVATLETAALQSLHVDAPVAAARDALAEPPSALRAPMPPEWDVPEEPSAVLASLQFEFGEHRIENPVLGAPVFIRIFKEESQLELWMKGSQGYVKIETYRICRWSGHLGPKKKSGDQQAPEGIYFVASEQLNPTSRRHRAFNLGYPNLLDRELGRTGSLLEVHGGCSSRGCFAMTDPVIERIWRVVTAALSNGQKSFQVQVFPFRMTAANIEHHAHDPAAAFWQDLKKGYDIFEATFIPPKVTVCRGKYQFEPGASVRSEPIASCPSLHLARR